MSVLAPWKRIGWGFFLLGVVVSPAHAQGTAAAAPARASPPHVPAQATAPPAPAQPCGVPERLDTLEAKVRELDGSVKANEARVKAPEPSRPDPQLWISVIAVGIALALAWVARGYFEARAETAAVPLKLLDALAKRSPRGTIEEVLDHVDQVNAKLPLVRERLETLQKALELDRKAKRR